MTPRERFPVLSAALIYALAVAVAFWPFWTGHFLINPMSDMRNGYPFRLFESEYWHHVGGFPQWNPYIFGGMPFIGAIGGDVFYPTFLLRLVFPVDVGITLGFMLHIVLAGLFTFLFLRTLKLEWGAAFVGGAAYMFTGQVVSLVSPGHDGKLFVSALLPLALLFLYQAVVRNDWRRYLYFGATVGLSLISPHFQMTYFLLMAAGFFWAFLVFVSDERPAAPWWRSALPFVLALVRRLRHRRRPARAVSGVSRLRGTGSGEGIGGPVGIRHVVVHAPRRAPQHGLAGLLGDSGPVLGSQLLQAPQRVPGRRRARAGNVRPVSPGQAPPRLVLRVPRCLRDPVRAGRTHPVLPHPLRDSPRHQAHARAVDDLFPHGVQYGGAGRVRDAGAAHRRTGHSQDSPLVVARGRGRCRAHGVRGRI